MIKTAKTARKICLRNFYISIFCIFNFSTTYAAYLDTDSAYEFSMQNNEIKSWQEEVSDWENPELTKPIAELLKNGKKKEAKYALAQYLTKYPENMRAMELAAALLMEDKNYTAATDAFSRVLKKHPENNGVRTKLGVSLILMGKYEQGNSMLIKALNQNPNNELALTYLSWISQKNGDLYQAKNHLLQLVKLSEKDKLGKFYFALARLLSKEKQHSEVIKLLEPFSTKSPPNSFEFLNANILLANAYYDLGKVEETKKKVALLDKHFSSEVNVELLHGLLYRHKKQYTKAIAIYDSIILKNPAREIDAKLEIANTYALMGQTEKAIETLDFLTTKVEAKLVPSLVRDMLSILLSENEGV